MEYIVRTEKELVAALKKCEAKDCIWIKPDQYNANRNYIKEFTKNRKLNFQESLWSNRAILLTFY